MPKLKVMTDWSTLMKYARAEADACKAGDPVKLAEAVKQHEDYRQMCLNADGMIIPNTRSLRG